jgi:hypothetical protein
VDTQTPALERSRRYFASHVLARIAACEIGPIPNGVFIAAMIYCGHPFIRDRQQTVAQLVKVRLRHGYVMINKMETTSTLFLS